MKFQRKEKPEKVRTVKIGLRRKMVISLWALFIAAFVFAVYKNFTGIDTHTVHEVEVIETKIADTNGIESFVRKFVGQYYVWEDTSESLEARQASLKSYMTDDLITLNLDVISSEDGVSSSVLDMKLWELVQIDDCNFKVVYTVRQSIKRIVTEMETEYVEEPEMTEVINEETGEVSYVESIVQREVETPVSSTTDNAVESCYMVVVHMDDAGDMVITQNPTVASISGKSDYMPETLSSDGSVDGDTAREISDFLTAFFKLYPTADNAELAYYVKNDALSPIAKVYEFRGITDSVYRQTDGQIFAYVTVKYYDEEAGINHLSQFTLGLEKSENWFIISNALLSGD